MGVRLVRSRYQGINVLVTGADGFIGSHLVERLVELGANLTALSHYNAFHSIGWLDDLPVPIRRTLTLVRGDVRDHGFVRRIMAQQEIVFHLAALVAVPHSYAAPQCFIDTNVTGTLNILEAARDHQVRRIIHTSTSEVYAPAIDAAITEAHRLQGNSPYSASRIGADMLAESFARSFCLPVAILRPFNIFGPRQNERAVIASIIRQSLDATVSSIETGDVTPVRDFTYVDDLVTAFVRLGAMDEIDLGRTYNAGSGQPVSIGAVIERIIALTGCDKPLVKTSVGFRPPGSEAPELVADATALSSAAGWSPLIDLKEGLSRTIDWWRARIAAGRVSPEVGYAS